MNTNLNFAEVYIDDWPNYYWYCFDSIDCLVWKKEKISLFHDFHYDEVSAEEKKAFCTISVIGVVLIGIGIRYKN